MNGFERSLISEYKKLCCREKECETERRSLPAGSIQIKRIGGREYHYLQFREGSKVKSRYIKRSELKEISERIEKRKEVEAKLYEIRARKKALEGVMDKDSIMISMIRMAVLKVVREYPEIKKVILFGSRAESRYRDDSDVDLYFESSGPVSLMRQNEFRMKLEEELDLEVDLVHGPVGDSFLKIGKEVNVYAA